MGKAATCTSLGLRRSRARVEGTQRQNKFQPITSAETRGAGGGRGRGTEGRAPGAAIDGARQKKETKSHAALHGPGCRTPACNSTIRVPLTLWTRRRRWTLQPLQKRCRFPGRWQIARKDALHHRTRLGRRPHDAPNGDRHAAEILRARLFPCPNRAPAQCRLRRRTSATPMRINQVCSD